MKNYFLLLAFVVGAFIVNAQTADRNYTLLLNGKQFHVSDSVLKTDFSNLEKSAIQVVDTRTGKKYTPESYQWVVSVKDSNGIWKGAVTSNPPNKDPQVQQRLDKVLNTAKKGDVIFLDEFVYPKGTAGLPKSFAFTLR